MSEVDPVRKFFGGALMAVGGLIAALCGTCSLVMFGSAALSSLRYPDVLMGLFGMAFAVAIVGGVPTVIGVLVARWGWRLYRPSPKVRRATIAVFSDPPDEEKK